MLQNWRKKGKETEGEEQSEISKMVSDIAKETEAKMLGSAKQEEKKGIFNKLFSLFKKKPEEKKEESKEEKKLEEKKPVEKPKETKPVKKISVEQVKKQVQEKKKKPKIKSK